LLAWGKFFVNFSSIANFLATFSHSTYMFVVFFFTKNALGYILSDYLKNLIWSPCSQTSLCSQWRGISRTAFMKGKLLCDLIGGKLRPGKFEAWEV
jgi:hypothetical protein